ncbi:MAG: hypothetical protein JRI73_08385 [Deltaproteobacteria bacterium]|nr:hypothetical protein [Deltaproteobacteria bacterium]
MNRVRLGCQTYTWQMSGDKYLNKLSHIIQIASQAGYAGIEPEVQFLGGLSDPAKMTEVLQTHSIELAAVCLVEDWTNKEETEQERANADLLIEFLKHFPDTLLALCQMPGTNRDNLDERQRNLLSCVNTLAQHAADEGIKCGYHPNSPQGSIFRKSTPWGKAVSILWQLHKCCRILVLTVGLSWKMSARRQFPIPTGLHKVMGYI